MWDALADNKILMILFLGTLVVGIFSGTIKIIAPLISILWSVIIMIKSASCLLYDHFLDYNEFKKKLMNAKFKLDGKIYLSGNNAWYYTYGWSGSGPKSSPTKWQTIIHDQDDLFDFLKIHKIQLVENPSFSEKHKAEIHCWIFLIASIIVLLGAIYRVLLYFGII